MVRSLELVGDMTVFFPNDFMGCSEPIFMIPVLPPYAIEKRKPCFGAEPDSAVGADLDGIDPVID